MDNIYIIIGIIIIIITSLYLYYRHYEYNKILESFSNNNSQSSLSTFFQGTTDYNQFNSNINSYDTLGSPKDLRKVGWDGIWQNKDEHMNANFIQNNDKLIISFKNTSINKVYYNNSKKPLSNTTILTDPSYCHDNVFIGIGQLNNNRKSFILVEIICNNYINTDINISVNNLSGQLEGNIITLYSNNKQNNIQLTKESSLIYNSSSFPINNTYVKNSTILENSSPMVPLESLVNEESHCPENSVPCNYIQGGLSETTYNDSLNACGIPISSTDNICNGKPTCILYNSTSLGIPQCEKVSNTYDYMNISPFNVMNKTIGNSLQLSNILNNFGSSSANACILCYISNIGNVKTLNYQWFGVMQEESGLTVQNDTMNTLLNNSNYKIGVLPLARTQIQNKSTLDKTIIKALSFTNCLNNIKITSQTVNNQINTCLTTCNNYIKSYIPSITNNNLMPAIFEINPVILSSNSRSFYLNTCKLYSTPIKYVEAYKNTTTLSLFQGGSNQEFHFDDSFILSHNSQNSISNLILITTNIKSNDGLFLLPSSNSGISNSSTMIKLSPVIEHNSKWLIIGFTLNSLQSLSAQLQNF